MIPDEAVEAAREAIIDKFLDRSLDCWPDFENEARAALEAAAPIIQKQAWEEGAIAGWKQSGEGWNAEYPDESKGGCSVNLTANPYRRPGA